jgi:hypothetical protein
VTVTTDPVGYCNVTVAAGGGVAAPVFVKPAVYTGTAGFSGTQLSATGLTANSYGPTSFNDRPNAARYYVEITSGSYAGYTFDVTGNSSNSITVAGLPAELDGQSNVAIALRPHTTLGDLATASSGLTDYSDALTLYYSNNLKSSYFYTGSGILGDDYSTPCNQVVIYPGNGVLLNNGAIANFAQAGVVKTTPTVVSIPSGESLIAPVNPMGARISDLNLAPVLDPYTAAASLVSTTGNLGITSFYSDGSSLLDENYNPVNSTNAPIVAAGNGIIINTGNPSNWRITNPPIF